jgi:hypothetical protein
VLIRGDISDGAAVHPEQPAPADRVLISYDENGKTCAPGFFYLPR